MPKLEVAQPVALLYNTQLAWPKEITEMERSQMLILYFLSFLAN